MADCKLCNIENPNVRYKYWVRIKCPSCSQPLYVLKRHSANLIPAELFELAKIIDFSFSPNAEINCQTLSTTQHFRVHVYPEK